MSLKAECRHPATAMGWSHTLQPVWSWSVAPTRLLPTCRLSHAVGGSALSRPPPGLAWGLVCFQPRAVDRSNLSCHCASETVPRRGGAVV